MIESISCRYTTMSLVPTGPIYVMSSLYLITVFIIYHLSFTHFLIYPVQCNISLSYTWIKTFIVRRKTILSLLRADTSSQFAETPFIHSWSSVLLYLAWADAVFWENWDLKVLGNLVWIRNLSFITSHILMVVISDWSLPRTSRYLCLAHQRQLTDPKASPSSRRASANRPVIAYENTDNEAIFVHLI